MGALFDKLPHHYQIFVAEFLATGNLCKSAKASGSKAKNLSQAGNQLLRHADIVAALDELKEEAAKELRASPKTVLQEYARVGFSDIRQIFNEKGQLKPITDLDDDIAAAVSGIKVVTKVSGQDPLDVEYIHEIKLWPKNPALESLSRNLGLFEKDNDQRKLSLSEILRELDGGGLPAISDK